MLESDRDWLEDTIEIAHQEAGSCKHEPTRTQGFNCPEFLRWQTSYQEALSPDAQDRPWY